MTISFRTIAATIALLFPCSAIPTVAQPPVKAPTTQSANQPNSQPTPPVQPMAQAVQPTPEEASQVALAWSEAEKAQLKLELAVQTVRANHPGWLYDQQQRVFYVKVEQPVATTSTSAAPAKK